MILRQFSKDYADVFAEYIQGKDLTELQNQMERAREMSIKAKKSSGNRGSSQYVQRTSARPSEKIYHAAERIGW